MPDRIDNKKVVLLDEKAVKKLIEESPDQSTAVVGLYRMAFGDDWDKIASLDGWPKINEFTWQAIFVAFREWNDKQDPAYQEKYMAGGTWFNKGFSAYGGDHLKNWQVELCPYTLND